MSTIVEAKWTYGNIDGLYFCRAFNEVEKALVDNFAGPNATGLFSASVQKTMFDTQVYSFLIPKIIILILFVCFRSNV